MSLQFTFPNQQPDTSRARKNDDRESSDVIDVPDAILSTNLFPDLG